jgi:hypothetical protein
VTQIEVLACTSLLALTRQKEIGYRLLISSPGLVHLLPRDPKKKYLSIGFDEKSWGFEQ